MFATGGKRAFPDAVEALRPTEPATWDRARGWAVSMGSAMVASSDDNPVFLALGTEVPYCSPFECP